MKNYVTLKDIAKKAGVSMNTVSRALKDAYDISPKTKKEIIELAKQMGYIPDHTASALKGARTPVIGIILPNNSEYFFSHLLIGIQERAIANGYQIILSNTRRKREKEETIIELLLQRRVSGLIIWPSRDSYDQIIFLKKTGIPFVIVGHRYKIPSVNLVYDDSAKGAYIAAKKLFESGCKQVFFVKYQSQVEALKIQGIQKALKRNRRKFSDKIIINYEEAGPFVDQISADTGIFASSDEIALELLTMLKDRGIKVPEQVKMIGYGDSFLAQISYPKLSSIFLDIKRIGQESFELLMNSINRPDTPEKTQTIDVKYVQRESCL